MPRPSLLEGVAHCLQTTDNGDKTLKEPLGEWLSSPWQLFHWDISANGQRLYKKCIDHAIVHLRKHFHRNSQRLHRNILLQGKWYPLMEYLPTPFLYSQTRSKLNQTFKHYSQRDISDKPAKLHLLLIWGKLCTKVSSFWVTLKYIPGLNQWVLRLSGICIHIKPVHCEENMGFCYEILRPPRSTPLFWYMNSIPIKDKEPSNKSRKRNQANQPMWKNILKPIQHCSFSCSVWWTRSKPSPVPN